MSTVASRRRMMTTLGRAAGFVNGDTAARLRRRAFGPANVVHRAAQGRLTTFT
jgi:hypothetical protein